MALSGKLRVAMIASGAHALLAGTPIMASETRQESEQPAAVSPPSGATTVRASLAALPVLRPAPPLDAYGELPRVEDAAIAPDGRHIASIARYGMEGRLRVVTEAGKVVLNLGTGTSKVRGVEWADNDTVLVTTSATVPLEGFAADMYEMSATLAVPIDGAAAFAVFGKSQQVAATTRGRYGIRTVGGKTLGFFGGIALDISKTGPVFVHGRTTLYAVDIETNKAREVAGPPAQKHWRDWLVDGNGHVAVMLDLDESTGAWKIAVPKGAELARGNDPAGSVSLVCFGKDGDTAIYSVRDQDGESHWFELPLAGGEPREILAEETVERIFVDRGNGRLMGYQIDAERPKAVMFDAARQSALQRTFAAFAGAYPILIDWTPDFSKVLLRTGGNQDSGTWFLVDVAKRRADPIGDERPAIAPEQVGKVSVVTYKAADGLEMDGVLTMPPGGKLSNLPIVVLPHGGPAAEDKPGFDWWAQAFASRGYAVFQPNFRGSTGRSGAFLRAGDGQWGRKMQTDISDGLAELARRGVVDPRRACIVGASYGGYAALAGVTLQQGIYRCAVSVAGIGDIQVMYDTDIREDNYSKLTVRLLREQLGERSGYAAISPRRFAAKADAPIMLIHGKDDTVVPFRQSTMMADTLKDAGKPYEMIPLASEDHWLSREETRKRMLSETMRFVQKYNPAD